MLSMMQSVTQVKYLKNPLDDTITAALFCLSSSIAVSYPNPTELQRIASVADLTNQEVLINQVEMWQMQNYRMNF